MTKEERLKYMRQNYRKYKDAESVVAPAVFPTTQGEIKETIRGMDGFREHVREKKDTLNADEQ